MSGTKKQAKLDSFFTVKRPNQPAVPTPAEPTGSGEAALPQESPGVSNHSDPDTNIPTPKQTIPGPEKPDSVRLGPQKETVDAWIRQFPWLKPEWIDGKQCTLKKMFCSICQDAEEKNILSVETKRKEVYTSTGFSDWPNARNRFAKHEESQSHRTAMTLLKSVTPQLANILTSAATKSMKDASIALHNIFDAIRYLAGQGLAFRRKEEESGNFNRLLDLLQDRVPELKQFRSSGASFSYTSPQVQNEILEMLAHAVTSKIFKEVQTAPYFSIIMDETTDITRQQQVAVCFRFVAQDLNIYEEFSGLYQITDASAATLAKVARDVMLRLQLDPTRLCGQCYDGAANMSGERGGVQALLKVDSPMAVTVHCTGHRLNLVVQDALTNVVDLDNVVDVVGSIVGFVRDSPKRLAAFGAEGPESALRPLCPTRWTCRDSSIRSVLQNYRQLMNFLEGMVNDRMLRADIRATARGYLNTMTTFKFFFGASLASRLLAMVTPVTRAVQGSRITLNDALRLVSQLTTALAGQREKFLPFWADLVKEAEELGVDEPLLPRPTKRPKRLDDGSPAHQDCSPEAAYRRLYFQGIDALSTSLNSRFGENADNSLLVKGEQGIISNDQKALVEVAAFFQLDHERLRLHVSMMHDIITERDVSVTCLKDVQLLLQADTTLCTLLSELTLLLKVLLTVPATSCTAERSFSMLRRLKVWLRSTMTQARLNHAAICAAYPEELRHLSLPDLEKEFIRRCSARRSRFAVP